MSVPLVPAVTTPIIPHPIPPAPFSNNFIAGGIANSPFKNIKQSSTHPKFLHSNSTSHVWAFSAIAELIDNASDPDVQATELNIDSELDGVPRLIFADNGFGMVPQKLHKMLSFGYCEKVEVNGHKPIGHYGNGFKSGSMRLGKDALVFTKEKDTMSCGFLSQTFLDATGSDCVIVPMITWNLQKKLLTPEAEAAENLKPIYLFSPYASLDVLLAQFEKIKKTGTTIIIFNLRREGLRNEMLEFNFEEDKRDIRIRGDNQVAGTVGAAGRNFKRQRVNQDPTSDIPLDYSLRAYCEVLYLRPRMKIYIRSFKVRTKLIAHSLSKTRLDTYRPLGSTVSTKITYGLNTENPNVYGMMLYHRNRLIKPYVRVGIQLQNNKEGVGVIGIIEADFLQPTHNKQDFDQTPAYRNCIAKLSDQLETYWNDITVVSANKKQLSSQISNTTTPSQQLQSQSQPQSQARIILLPFTNTPMDDKPDYITVSPPSATAEASTVAEGQTPDETWVQCDSCLKWRKLPANTKVDSLPERWYCYLNTCDPARADCQVPQQADDEPDNFISLKSVRKKLKEIAQSKKAEEAKQLAAAHQQEMLKRQSEEQKLQEMQAETARLKAEQEKQRKIIEDQQRRELQYQEQVRAMLEKEQIIKQKEATLKEEERKRKELETWLQSEETHLKKRKVEEERPKIEEEPLDLNKAPESEPTFPANAHIKQQYPHIQTSAYSPVTSLSTSSPSAPNHTAQVQHKPPKTTPPTRPPITHAPTTHVPTSHANATHTSIHTTTTHATTAAPAHTPTHIPHATAPVPSEFSHTLLPSTIPVHITPTLDDAFAQPTPPLSTSIQSLHRSAPNLPPSTVPSTPPVQEAYKKACNNMAQLVSLLSVPGFKATSDPQDLAALDVVKFAEQARSTYVEKPQAELATLRLWIRKLLGLLARSKEISAEDSELDTYFVEWVKRQESKRKGEDVNK